MEEKKRRAYYFILSLMTGDVRLYGWTDGPLSVWNFIRYREAPRNRFAKELSELTNTLAWYASRDFEGFDEDEFWASVERIKSRFPRFGMELRGQFEWCLQENSYTEQRPKA